MVAVGLCLVRYLLIVAPVAVALVLARRLLPVPREVSRKALHAVAFLSTPALMAMAGSWQVATGALVLIAVVIYPVLVLGERLPGYADLFVQRAPGEVRRSLLLLFVGDAGVVALCWGAFGLPWAAVASILMWGTGDAVAALVGKRWGTHHVRLPLADPRKTWEGSLAMMAVSALVGGATLAMLWRHGWVSCLALALPTAMVGAFVELVTRGGYDTITVPYANAVVILALYLLLPLLS